MRTRRCGKKSKRGCVCSQHYVFDVDARLDHARKYGPKNQGGDGCCNEPIGNASTHDFSLVMQNESVVGTASEGPALFGWLFRSYSFPKLPPPNIKSVKRPLDRWHSKPPIESNTPAETAPLEPGTSGKRLQRIGKQQREQILMLGAAQWNLLAGQAVLHGRVSVFSEIQEKGFSTHHAKQPDQRLHLFPDQLPHLVSPGEWNRCLLVMFSAVDRMKQTRITQGWPGSPLH